MSTRRLSALVVACTLLGACGSSTTPESSPPPTRAPETSAPDQAPDPGSTIETLADGILVVEPSSGDLLRYSSGRWEVVYDGLSYDAEVEGDAAYVESAFSAQGATFAALCCEPFSGIFGKVQAGEVQYSGYGTRPALLGERIVAFIDVFDEQVVTKLAISSLASPQDVLFESVLSGVAAHSTRLQPLGEDHVAFTWSPSVEGAPWYLAVVDLSEPVSYDVPALLERSVKLLGVRDIALVVDGSGRVALLSQGGTPLLEFYEQGDGVVPARSGAVESVPAGASAVLVDGTVRAYLFGGGVSVSDGSKEKVLPGSFTWMGR